MGRKIKISKIAAHNLWRPTIAPIWPTISFPSLLDASNQAFLCENCLPILAKMTKIWILASFANFCLPYLTKKSKFQKISLHIFKTSPKVLYKVYAEKVTIFIFWPFYMKICFQFQQKWPKYGFWPVWPVLAAIFDKKIKISKTPKPHF